MMARLFQSRRRCVLKKHISNTCFGMCCRRRCQKQVLLVENFRRKYWCHKNFRRKYILVSFHGFTLVHLHDFGFSLSRRGIYTVVACKTTLSILKCLVVLVLLLNQILATFITRFIKKQTLFTPV